MNNFLSPTTSVKIVLPNKPLLTILIPSRERAKDLQFSLESLQIQKNNIEVLVWIDEDDPQREQYHEFFANEKQIKMFIKPRVGYLQFHTMLDFLTQYATGQWMMLWNDDAYMDNPNWYDIFVEYSSLSKPLDEPVVYNLWGQGEEQNLFPIISKKYYEIIGHWARNCVCDVWVKSVATKSNIQRYIFGIKPKHRKFGMDTDLGDLVDTTTHEIEGLVEKSRFLGARSKSAFQGREADSMKILNWIKEQNDRSARVGFIGLGKLGLPVALAIESRGKNVIGYDINPQVKEYVNQKTVPYQEQWVDKKLKYSQLEVTDSIETVVTNSNLIFCAIQTPHDERFEGDKPLTAPPTDFDYSHLKQAIQGIVHAANSLPEKTTLVVISTCLPGTFEREIKPLLSDKINYVYNPYFIAMGTVMRDFLNPEFILIGNNNQDITPLTHFYKMILGTDKTFVTDITTAEGIKVFYNTYITMKIVLANAYGEMSHKLGMNVDHIYEALSRATDRIMSPKYLRAGVGDGGGCHPRDNIALSFLANKHNPSGGE
jgi:3-hydroxyisobutyrate dehydrogenase-like beta-hydroxyacid dehydrogenase